MSILKTEEAIGDHDTVTILTCCGKENVATKTFHVRKDGGIEKRPFWAGKFFTWEERPVSNLNELARLLDDMQRQSKKFLIRGKPKTGVTKIVQKKIHEPDAAFDAAARRYVMLDFDKIDLPQHLDVVRNSEEVVRWVLALLPKSFQGVSCYYKFSSSQNVPARLGEAPAQKVSLHLWFYCDRPVSDGEWKRLFKTAATPVDCALFSPVQIHYTANPIFIGMTDPLPKRSGILRGDRDILNVPPIPEQEKKKPILREEKDPAVEKTARDRAIELFRPHYKEGTRARYTGAIAATLYRKGWQAENAAEFVRDLAIAENDSEAESRHDAALRICDAIDTDRPAPGIPTLQEESGIKNLNEILSLLGVGEPDVRQAIGKLTNKSDTPEIKEVLKLLILLPEGDRNLYLEEIKKSTSQSKGTLQAFLKEIQKQAQPAPSIDWADLMMETFLNERFKAGRYLMCAADGNYWAYGGARWAITPEEYLKHEMLSYARETFTISAGAKEVSSLLNASLNILEGRVYRQDDPLRLSDSVVPKVINCKNGELWFDDNGDVVFKPHVAESYLRHSVNVSYDPSALCPLFEKAALDIFAKSSEPEEMLRHFMEVAGYICQPWRKLAVIILLYGGGNNGKTSLMGVIVRILGIQMVMFDRISEIEESVFKVGALDGKLMLLDDDVDEGTCIPDGFLKKISEEKPMTGQHKHKPPFDFICRAVPVMLANAHPSLKDMSEGMRRRMMVIPFLRQFEKHEVIPGLFDNIWEKEASGILNLIIAGFQGLKKRGCFDEPQECLQAKQEWLVRSNILAFFIEEVCKKGADKREKVKDLYAAFQNYCKDAGVHNVLTRLSFKKRLESLGYGMGTTDGYDMVIGLSMGAEKERKEEKEPF